MWRDKGLDINIEEGTYWFDNQIIKTFDHNGELCYLYRIKTSDDLQLSIAKHKDFNKHKNKQFETWQETLHRLSSHLEELENESIQLLKEYGLHTDRIIIDTNSTGKDSMVKTYLANKAGLKFDTYFNVTTLDVPESNKMAKELDYKRTYPNKRYGGFYQWIEKENIIPSRLNRCCCQYFKENPTIDSFNDNEKILFLFGMRNDESNARSEYTDIWKNHKWGNRDWIGLLPIRKWTDLDIWLYIFKENIPINGKYLYGYDRVGCGIACPNYTRTTWVLDQYYYPKMYDRWQRIIKEDFIKNNKWLIMNCTIDEYIKGAWTGGVYRPEPTEEVIQEYAQYSEMDIDIARKYFNRYCMSGCKNKRSMPLKIKDKETLAMNMKFFGRHIEKFMCKKCLMKLLEIDKAKWNDYIQSFKEQGCKLF